MSTNDTPWIKATKSDNGGNCVEMRRHDGQVQIRDTKAQGKGPSLTTSRDEFTTWLDGARRGEFDHLLAD